MSDNEHFLSIREILKHSAQELCKRFWPFFFLALIGPLTAWLLRGVSIGFDPLQNLSQAPNWLAIAFISLLTIFFSLWSVVALVLFICKRADTWHELFKLSFMRLPRVIAGLFVYFFLMGLYLVLSMIIVGYIAQSTHTALQLLAVLLAIAVLISLTVCWVYFLLLPYILILTNIPIWMSLPSAFTLIKNHFWKTFVLLLCLFGIALVVSLVCSVVLGLSSVLGFLIWPASRYIFGALAIIPTALSLLIYHLPMIALYINLSTSWQEQEQREVGINETV